MDLRGGSFQLNGETGLSAGFKDEVEQIVGLPRTIFLYDNVTDSGSVASFRIVGFAGITVLDSSLTGTDKYIRIQPTFVSDPTAISGNSAGQNYFVSSPTIIKLAR
jgi:hypothetical protein